MSYRVDRIAVQMDVYEEFEGHTVIRLEYQPEPGDALVVAALAKNDAMIHAQIAMEGSINLPIG